MFIILISINANSDIIINKCIFKKEIILSSSDKGLIKLEGVVVDVLPALNFKIELPNGKFVIATLCGKMRRSRRESLKIIKNDKVVIELSIHDLSIGRIVYRYPRSKVKPAT